MNQLYVISIPNNVQLFLTISNNVQEALKDFRWREAMNEEMKSF